MTVANAIAETVLKYPELKIIYSQIVYKEKFSDVSEQAFYKTLSRMEKKGEINRITKGVYCRPKIGRLGIVVSGETDILEYLLGKNKNKGIVIGYKMYSSYELTTQVSKTVNVYSNVPYQENKVIKNVHARRVDLKFEPAVVKLIELLEVLEHFRSIENLNKLKLFSFLEMSAKYYDEKLLHKVQKQIGYKKSTLASLKNVLDYFDISNSLSHYLKETSTYTAINMEDLI